MTLKVLIASAALGAALLAATAAEATDTTLANGPANATLSYLGFIGSSTVGEVITAPVTGELTSFTLSLDGPDGDLYGGVGTWTDSTSGSPTNLYQSAAVSSPTAASYTFSPNVPVIAGDKYVVYLSDYQVSGEISYTSVPIVVSETTPYLDGLAYNQLTDERNNPSWTSGAPDPEDNLLVSATFSPIVISAAPEPATWALMIAGIGMIGGMMRTRARAPFRDITAA
jgi:hypothetical protein